MGWEAEFRQAMTALSPGKSTLKALKSLQCIPTFIHRQRNICALIRHISALFISRHKDGNGLSHYLVPWYPNNRALISDHSLMLYWFPGWHGNASLRWVLHRSHPTCCCSGVQPLLILPPPAAGQRKDRRLLWVDKRREHIAQEGARGSPKDEPLIQKWIKIVILRQWIEGWEK